MIISKFRAPKLLSFTVLLFEPNNDLRLTDGKETKDPTCDVESCGRTVSLGIGDPVDSPAFEPLHIVMLSHVPNIQVAACSELVPVT